MCSTTIALKSCIRVLIGGIIEVQANAAFGVPSYATEVMIISSKEPCVLTYTSQVLSIPRHLKRRRLGPIDGQPKVVIRESIHLVAKRCIRVLYPL